MPAPIPQAKMPQIPVPPGSKAALEAVRQEITAETGRKINLAETVERLLRAWETADGYRRELDEINDTLKAAGVTYPPGVRGVQEIIRQRDQYLTDLKERTS